MEMKEILSNIWFTVRWYTGIMLDVIIVIGSLFGAFWIFEKMFGVQPLVDLLGIPSSIVHSNFVGACITIAIFSAAMAGRQWVRTQYFTHILPEVWKDTIQKFMKEATKKDGK